MSFRNLDTPPSFAKNLVGGPGSAGSGSGGPSEASAWLGRVRDVVNNIMRGKLNCTGAVTLAAGAGGALLQRCAIRGARSAAAGDERQCRGGARQWDALFRCAGGGQRGDPPCQ